MLQDSDGLALEPDLLENDGLDRVKKAVAGAAEDVQEACKLMLLVDGRRLVPGHPVGGSVLAPAPGHGPLHDDLGQPALQIHALPLLQMSRGFMRRDWDEPDAPVEGRQIIVADQIAVASLRQLFEPDQDLSADALSLAVLADDHAAQDKVPRLGAQPHGAHDVAAVFRHQHDVGRVRSRPRPRIGIKRIDALHIRAPDHAQVDHEGFLRGSLDSESDPSPRIRPG